MRKLFILLSTFATLAFVPVMASAQSVTAPSLYAVKFVCGLQSPAGLTPPSEPPVKPGNYATKINIELLAGVVSTNASAVTANISVAGLTSTAPLTISLSTLFEDQEVTCADIAPAIASLYPNGAPPPFVNGYVNIIPTSRALLAVTAVYTAQGYSFPRIGSVFIPPTPSAQVSIDVVPESPITISTVNP